MASYCGSIGSVNVLEFVSTDLFDESQENPFLLQQHQQQQPHQSCSSANSNYSSPVSKLKSSPAKHQSVRFAELPLSDQRDNARASIAPSPVKAAAAWSPQSSPAKRQSTASPVILPPSTYNYQQTPLPTESATVSFSPPRSPTQRPSITISLPYPLFQRQGSTDSNASTMGSQADHDAFLTTEEAELHKLLYSLTRLGLGQQQQQQQPLQDQQPPPLHGSAASYASTASAPTSPLGFSSSSLWLPSTSASQSPSPPQPTPTTTTTASGQPTGTASLMFRALPSRQSSRRASSRQSTKMTRSSSAPNSPHRQEADGYFSEGEEMENVGVPRHGMDGYGGTGYGGSSSSSQPATPHAHNSRGSVTFLTVKNLLRGGGALARTVRHEQPTRRPTCHGTVSSRLKRRQKFQRATVITDAYHRVSDMKLGTSPMKVKIKHQAFPQTWHNDGDDDDDDDENGDGNGGDHQHGDSATAPGSPHGRSLRRGSLVTLETLDKIGTRHACPVQLIEEALPDFSNIQPRVDTWNHYKKPKQNLRRPSAWLLGATATSTPHGLHG